MATITGETLEMNTYLKVLSQVYFDHDIQYDRKDFVSYIYILFANDHHSDDLSFGIDLLQHYIENNFSEYNAASASSAQKSEKQSLKKKVSDSLKKREAQLMEQLEA